MNDGEKRTVQDHGLAQFFFLRSFFSWPNWHVTGTVSNQWWPCLFEICKQTHTDRQDRETHRHTRHNALHPSRGWSDDYNRLIINTPISRVLVMRHLIWPEYAMQIVYRCVYEWTADASMYGVPSGQGRMRSAWVLWWNWSCLSFRRLSAKHW